ncbi:MAG: PAS domain S-box protein [Proteobacteria bacterium]|nr:PAS domain S-box protein [Pseudomonadota bacterium]
MAQGSDVLQRARAFLFAYLLFAAAGIFLSDVLVARVVSDRATLALIGMLKDWFFVLVGAGLFYWQILGIARAKARAKEDVGRWLQAFRSAHLGFALHDVETNSFIEVNDAYARMHGFTAEELRGRPVLEMYAPEERAGLLARLAGIDQSGQQSFETVHLTRSGERLAVLMGITPLRDADGRIRSRFAYSIDYSRRKEAEMQLRKLSQAVEQSPESIVITNLDAQIEYVNAAFVRATGYTREEVLGCNPRVLQSHRTPVQSYAEMWDALTHGRPWTGEFHNRRKDGSEYCEIARIAPIRNEAGCVTHYVAVKEDITERKRLNAELTAYREHLEELVRRRTAELEEATRVAEAASRAKSDFLATMSHEIRTPMNGIVGIAEILRQSELPGAQLELVDTMRDSAFNLLRIIDDILDFSKIEAGRLECVREPVNLSELVEGVCDALHPMAARKGVELRVHVDPALPGLILGDELRLRQILNNLVGNAIKFSAGLQRPGLVRVRAVPAGAAELRLEVIDNGIGMAAEVVSRLFTPFTQAEASTTRRYGGTGLGLAICRRLLEVMGGRIEVESARDAGSRFIATLPLAAAPRQAHGEAPPPVAGLSCLVAGRDPLTVSGWSAYLTHAGARVRLQPSLEAVRTALDAEDPATCVLITDMADAQERWRSLRDAFPGIGLLVITRGSRRRPRREIDRLVSLDGGVLRRRAFLDAVALAAGRGAPVAVPQVQRASAPRVPDADEAAAAGQLILVAEDDAINRKVIEHQLAVLGLACEFAFDGREALQRWRSGRYALLLTDLHMPEMDGYELTAAIRREAGAGPRFPVIALTANAIRGEDARCKALGMDAYLSKPVPIEVLRKTLACWLPAPPGRPDQPDQPAMATRQGAAQGLPVLDVGVLAGLIGDDEALIDEFLQNYRESLEAAVKRIRLAHGGGDWKQVAAVAHQLKSSSRSVGAMELGEVCAAFEQAGRTDAADRIVAPWAAFESAVARVSQAIEARPRPA